MSYKIPYRPEIDGLRALAVLGVVLYHADLKFSAAKFMTGGFIGVDVFFVISGYLITKILLKNLETNRLDLIHFFEKRMRRIFPLLALVILTTMSLGWVLLLPNDYKLLSQSVLSATGFYSNFYFWSQDPYWAAESSLKPLLHTWSLAIEEQFYLVVPLVLILIKKFNYSTKLLVLTALLLTSLTFANWSAYQMPQAAFFLLPSRFWELLSGSILSLLEKSNLFKDKYSNYSKILPKLGLSLLIFSGFYFSDSTPHPSFFTVLPILGTSLIIFFSNQNELTTKILSLKALSSIGLISYGLYLWHFILFSFSKNIFVYSSNIRSVLIIFISIFLSVISYFFVEQPFRDKNRVSTNVFIGVIGFIIVTVAIWAYAGSINGFQKRFPNALNQPSKPKKFTNHIWINYSPDNKSSIILVGDSHMGSLAPSFLKEAKNRGINFSVSIGCPLILKTHKVDKNTLSNVRCSIASQKRRFKFIAQAPNSTIVFGGRFQLYLNETRFNNEEGGREGPYEDFFQNSENSLNTLKERQSFLRYEIKATVGKILDKGHQVLLIYPIPEVGWHVPKKIFYDSLFNKSSNNLFSESTRLTTSKEVFFKRTLSTYVMLDELKHPNLMRFYPENIFCESKNYNRRCITHDDSKIFYTDTNHLSNDGASLLTKEIFQNFKF